MSALISLGQSRNAPLPMYLMSEMLVFTVNSSGNSLNAPEAMPAIL